MWSRCPAAFSRVRINPFETGLRTTIIELITLLQRKRGVSVQTFEEHWLNVHALLVATAFCLKRYVQSHAPIQGYAKGDLLLDGVDDWFESAQAMRAFRESA